MGIAELCVLSPVQKPLDKGSETLRSASLRLQTAMMQVNVHSPTLELERAAHAYVHFTTDTCPVLSCGLRTERSMVSVGTTTILLLAIALASVPDGVSYG